MEERRQLLLAELGWLKSSLLALKERKEEINSNIFSQAFSTYKARVEKIRKLLRDYATLQGGKSDEA